MSAVPAIAIAFCITAYTAAWRATTVDQADAREKLVLAVNIVGKGRDHLAAIVMDSKLAAAQIKGIAEAAEPASVQSAAVMARPGSFSRIEWGDRIWLTMFSPTDGCQSGDFVMRASPACAAEAASARRRPAHPGSEGMRFSLRK